MNSTASGGRMRMEAGGVTSIVIPARAFISALNNIHSQTALAGFLIF